MKLEGTNHANDKFYINKLINTRFSFLRYILQLIKQTIKIYSVSHSAIIQSEKRKKLQRYSKYLLIQSLDVWFGMVCYSELTSSLLSAEIKLIIIIAIMGFISAVLSGA